MNVAGPFTSAVATRPYFIIEASNLGGVRHSCLYEGIVLPCGQGLWISHNIPIGTHLASYLRVKAPYRSSWHFSYSMAQSLTDATTSPTR